MPNEDSGSSKPASNSTADKIFNSPLNDVLLRFHRLLSTSKGTEAFLVLISHSSILVHSQLHRLLEFNLRAIAERTANDVSKTLQPGETIITSLPIPSITQRIADLQEGSKALEHTIEDVRAFLRLFSLLGIWKWARKTYYYGPKDKLLRYVIWSQIHVDAFACLIEGPAYLATKGIIRGWSKETQDKWLRWSAQCFIAHLVLDFIKLWRKSRILQRANEPADSSVERSIPNMEKEHWWRDFYISSAYSPLSIQWGLSGNYISETWVGLLGTIAGYFEFKEAWEEAAEE